MPSLELLHYDDLSPTLISEGLIFNIVSPPSKKYLSATLPNVCTILPYLFSSQWGVLHVALECKINFFASRVFPPSSGKKFIIILQYVSVEHHKKTLLCRHDKVSWVIPSLQFRGQSNNLKGISSEDVPLFYSIKAPHN